MRKNKKEKKHKSFQKIRKVLRSTIAMLIGGIIGIVIIGFTALFVRNKTKKKK